MQTQDIQKIIEDVLTQMGVVFEEIRVTVDNEIGVTLFLVRTPESKTLVGTNGVVLQAINYTVKKILEQKMAFSADRADYQKPLGFFVDIENYYSRRIDMLKTKARIVADRARSFKRNIDLEPMLPYERLIIHSYLARYPDIETESSGTGRERHIIVKHKVSEAL